MKKLWTLVLYVLFLTACATAPVPTQSVEPTAATQTPAPQVAAGEDPNPYTAAFAAAFCAQDAQALYAALANGSGIKDGLTGEADYYAQLIDSQTQGAANVITEVGAETNTDVAAMLVALDAKAAALKAENSPVAILAAEIKLSDGATCTMTFKASFTNKYGGYNAVYVITYFRADGTSDGNFFVLSAGNGGVDGVQ